MFRVWFAAAREREGSIASTYDTFVPNQMHGLQQLAELQERVKEGALTVDEALEHFSDWQQVEKKAEAKQEVGPRGCNQLAELSSIPGICSAAALVLKALV